MNDRFKFRGVLTVEYGGENADDKTVDLIIEKAVDGLLAVWRATDHTTEQGSIAYNVLRDLNIKPLDRIKALEQIGENK